MWNNIFPPKLLDALQELKESMTPAQYAEWLDNIPESPEVTHDSEDLARLITPPENAHKRLKT